ncbi:WxcM-like domain-containing protein [Vibrio cholerae]|uniref:WxcM-like domain-containing protein n=3 Tax=Vibrio cholerae TaxID=666 RepID=UPI002051B260|nr:putative acetyltransferase [Vibrio cholerae]GHW66713.1 dTDP-D-Fucp3N acetyltransferase [Vibrio cholerae]
MFIHEKAICESNNIGSGTKVWAFAHILPGAKVGNNVNVCDGVFIENDVIIGNNVTIKCGVQLWDGVRVGNNVFIGPNATFSNDKYPRSKCYPDSFSPTTIEDGASIGANATILPGVTIGMHAMVGAGAVVTRNVPPYATVIGNPAKIVNYNTEKNSVTRQPDKPHKSDNEMKVRGCKIIHFPSFSDMRGSLVVCEYRKHIPFVPKRSFFVHSVETDKVRGEHAHKECHQLLVALSGSLSVVVDDGVERDEIILDSPTLGLLIPKCVWGIQYKFSRDAILLVYASEEYDDEDYLRNYDEFISYTKEQQAI